MPLFDPAKLTMQIQDIRSDPRDDVGGGVQTLCYLRLRMGFRDRIVATALALAALAVAGCGGGDETTESTPTTTTATTALTKQELIAQGDAICAEVNAAVGGVGTGSGSEAGGAAGQVANLYVGMVESLKRLGTPQEAAGYAEFSSAADELSKAEGEVKLAAERGDAAALETAESNASAALASFQSEAQAYGFEACTEGPSAVTPAAGEEGSEEPSGGVEEEAAPEEAEAAPETGGAGTEAGGGAEAGGGGTGGGAGGGAEGGGGSSGGIGPG